MIGSLTVETIPGAKPQEVLWRMLQLGIFVAGRNAALPEDHEDALLPELGGEDAAFCLRKKGPDVLGYLVDGDGLEVDDDVLGYLATTFLSDGGPPLRISGFHAVRSGQLVCMTEVRLRDGIPVVSQTRQMVGRRPEREMPGI